MGDHAHISVSASDTSDETETRRMASGRVGVAIGEGGAGFRGTNRYGWTAARRRPRFCGSRSS